MRLQVAAVSLVILLAAALLWFNNATSMQANAALVVEVYFEGEYRIADGEWMPIEEGVHISSTKGDVTLRGNLHMLDPEGNYVGIYRGDIPVAFYLNHIGLTFYEGDGEPCVDDSENPLCGKSSCAESWTAYSFMGPEEELIEIVVHNPHAFGNENAIDDMLSKIGLWTGIEFEKAELNSGASGRNIGLMFVIIAIMLLGIAIFSTLIHVKNTKLIWVLGALTLCAGGYYVYSSKGVYFWSDSIATNTTVLISSMMFYMLFIIMLITCVLRITSRVGNITVAVLLAADAVCFLLPVISRLYFFDVMLWWIFVQIAANAVIAVCLIKEFINSVTHMKWVYLGSLLPLISFLVDIIGNCFGIWIGAIVSQYVFGVLFAVAVLMVLKLIPGNINAAAKAKELEMERIVLNAELAESRISTMMSQIRPHFIYNTLGSIEQLCEIDPPKAGELVHDFAKYLRGNFGELDNPKPIPMSKEMEHVRHYVSIENVRFPDMTVTFEMNTEDFNIPALTIQPIVENAIKHGLMRLERGGAIHVASYETESAYCVSVTDNGVGFDTTLLLDERKHVGLRNIRERLKAMVGGSIEIESTVGVGTKVLINIPKEAKK